MKLTLYDYQQEIVDSISDGTSNAALLAAGLGTGKAQPLFEPVLTPDGFKPMGDITLGDSVIGADGKPTEVIGVYPQGEQDIYKVRFDDDSYTYATGDHLWSVRTAKSKSRGKPNSVVTTLELQRNHFIPMVHPVEYPYKPVEIDPYLFGILLGDGGYSHAMVNVTTDHSIVEELVLPEGVSAHLKEELAGGVGTYSLRGMRKHWGSFAKANAKDIPEEYLLNSYSVRLAVFQGLMDSDGSPAGAAVEFGSVSKDLAYQVKELAESFGASVHLKTKRPFYSYKGERREGQLFYRLLITLPRGVIPFRVTRKLERWTPPSKYPSRRRVVSVTRAGRSEAQCIKVASRDSLYVTRNYVVTHNTAMAVETSRRLAMVNPVILVVCPLATMVGWERTFKNQGLAAPVKRITSKVAGKEAMESLKQGETGVYLIGREYFRRFKWDSFKKIGLCIVDEVHSVSARGAKADGTQGHKALMSLKPEFKLAMSGTPWGNKFENAYFVTNWLWPRPRKGGGFWRWVGKWAKQEEIVIGYDHEKQQPKMATKILGEKDPGEFVKSLPKYFRPELPPHPIVYDVLHTELMPAQRKIYDKFEKNSYVWLGEKALIEDIPIVERIRLREMTLGTIELDEFDNVVFTDQMKSSKVDVLLEFLADRPNEPVLILTHSKKFANIVAQRVKDSRLWTGDTPLEEREELIQSFGRDFKYLIATAPALAEGVDGLQQNCQTMVWLSRTENNFLNQQVEGRLARPASGGVKKQVLCVDIHAKDTYDEAVHNSLYFTERMIQQSLGGKK